MITVGLYSHKCSTCKISEIYKHLYPSIICIIEHWLTDNKHFILNKLLNYQLISIFSRIQTIRGGVFILAARSLPVEVMVGFSVEGYFESCVVLVNSLTPCIFISVYALLQLIKYLFKYLLRRLRNC